jgi:uncharacterized protein YjbI with pentapeptide repeats
MVLLAWLTLVFPAAPRAAQPPPAPSCAAGTGTGTNFAGQDLRNHNFSADPAGSLIGADFTGAKLSGALFTGQDLTSAKFLSANLGPDRGPVDFTNTKLVNTCFVGSVLDQTDFSFAQITCSDFSGASLIQASFGPTQNIIKGNGCRTKFNGATLDVHMISVDPVGNSNWGKTDFTAANFQNLSPQTFNLIGKDITGAILARTNFAAIDMTGANLTNVDFSRATLTRAVLRNTAINGAEFFNAQAQYANFQCAQGYGNGGGAKIEGGPHCPQEPTSTAPDRATGFRLAALKNADFTGAALDHAILTGANLTEAIFDYVSLTQANLQSGDDHTGPATVQFASFHRANLKNAQLSSVDFSGGTLTGANFSETSLFQTSFTNASMANADFGHATLQSVNFSAARLLSAIFSNTTIAAPGQGSGFGANFSCAQLGGADFNTAVISATNFSNAVMPAAQDCCPSEHDNPAWCGIVDSTQLPYGPVTFPVLNAIVTCPNGDTAKCTDSAQVRQWRLSPNWQTTGCNPNGVSQQMWSRPNCGGTPGKIVTFKDDNLKACILASLPGQTEVLLTTAQEIAQVNCAGRGITDLGGLENFISMTKLDLSANKLPTFTLAFTSGGQPVKSRLRTLALDSNALTTLDVTAHPALVSLTVSNNHLSTIALNADTYLVVLDASHNQLTSLDLSIQTSLSFADLSYNLLATILGQTNPSPELSRLGALNYLDLSHNVLTTIGSIAAIASSNTNNLQLQSLFLACNPKFQCGDLTIYDGTKFPAAASSRCSAYNAAGGNWTPLTHPDCPPG